MENQAATEQQQTEERGRSTVDFPYFDLDSGVEIAKAVSELGGFSCDTVSLAAKLEMAPDGGGFRGRLTAAKMFNIISYGRGSGGQLELTEIGRAIADPLTERKGRFDAFMAIPLYKTLFDRLKGALLPPPPAIDRMMEGMGVAPKQKDKARQVFLRSAKQAGLLDLTSDRLTPPPNLNTASAAAPAATTDDHHHQRKRGGGGDDNLPPFIRGLIDKLPPPDSEWDMTSRAKWLTTAANIFDLMYQGGSDTGIRVKMEGSTLSIVTGELA